MRSLFIGLGALALLSTAACDDAPAKAEPKPVQIKPESIVTFPNSAEICPTKAELGEILGEKIRGERTKYFSHNVVSGGDCIMALPDQRWKVISADYDSDEAEVGFLEIVPENTGAADHGGFVMPLMAEDVHLEKPPA